MRSRNLLHRNKLNEFKEWLITKGWNELPLKVWEVLRMRHVDTNEIMIVYTTMDAIEHYTIYGKSYRLYKEWKNDDSQ